MDFGHIYQTLARLDAGEDEKILLTSRDKRSLLVVSFADVKRSLEEAFAEIAGPAPGAGGTGPQGVGNQGGMRNGRQGMVVGTNSASMHGGVPGGRGMMMGEAGGVVPMGHHHPGHVHGGGGQHHPQGMALAMGMAGHHPGSSHGIGGPVPY